MLQTAEQLVREGDVDRLHKWLSHHSAQERAAIIQYFEQKEAAMPIPGALEEAMKRGFEDDDDADSGKQQRGDTAGGLAAALGTDGGRSSVRRILLPIQRCHQCTDAALLAWRLVDLARDALGNAEERMVRALLYGFTENAIYVDGKSFKPWLPTRRKIGDMLEALAALVILSDDSEQPCWIEPLTSPAPSLPSVMACSISLPGTCIHIRRSTSTRRAFRSITTAGAAADKVAGLSR